MYTLQGGQGQQRLSKQAWSSDMMAMDNSCFLFPHQPCFACWDSHSFGGGGDLHGLTLTPLEMESPSSSEVSTGYLQDAVVGWSERCKRRRTASSSTDNSTVAEDLQELFKGFGDSKWRGDHLESLSCVVTDDNNMITDNTWRSTMVPTKSNNITQQKKTAPQLQQRSEARGAWRPSLVTCPLKEEEHQERKKKAMGVVYPFVVAKPGGIEGDVTLADINKRILMRPIHPVHHPVGEFACRPCVSGADGGPGLSGKAVVGLTRIHTQGRGTITIIRTRG